VLLALFTIFSGILYRNVKKLKTYSLCWS